MECRRVEVAFFVLVSVEIKKDDIQHLLRVAAAAMTN